MADQTDDLQAIVQDAIDRGATSVEEVHRSIAALPLDVLDKIAPLQATQTVRGVQDATIGAVYDSIRLVNDAAGQIASKLLGRKKDSSEA